MSVDVLVGLQWGDEGKGKIVDILSPNYDVIARFQGGPNAGHTLVIKDKKFIFHTLPSGVVHKDSVNILGSGMVVDPITFRKEIASLTDSNIDPTNRILISKNASIIIPSHKILDNYYEYIKAEKKVGTTSRGIGPCYQDKIARVGLRFVDLLTGQLEEKYQQLKNRHLNILHDFSFDKAALEQEEKTWFEAIEFVKGFQITDTETYLNQQIKAGKKILAEGAQGSLLDINFGTFPYVTSSHTISAGACIGLGIAPSCINRVFGVVKAYTTRVGEGPFFTEQKNEIGEDLMKKGHEFGSTTGRPRRCGWLDLEALNYAIMLNGVTDLIITKADVLSGMDKIKLCDAYKDSENNIAKYSDNDLFDVIPSYKEFDGWQEDITQIKDFDELPENFKNYLNFIEQNTETKVSMISVGPERSQIVTK